MFTVRRIAVSGMVLSAAAVAGAQQPAANKANWTLANMFADQATMNRVSYTTNLVPNWINNGDSLWYNWRDRNACQFYVAYPRTKAKTAMFDHTRLASQLSTLHNKPFDPTRLPFNTLEFAKDAKSMSFGVEGKRYEWTFASQDLKYVGRDTISQGGGRGNLVNVGRGGNQQQTVTRSDATPQIQYCTGGGQQRNPNTPALGGGGGRGQVVQGQVGQAGQTTGVSPNVRNYSPDSTKFVFGRAYNVYLVNVSRNDTIQLSKDGERYRAFGGGGGGGGGQQQQQDSTDNNNNDTQADSIAALNRPVRVAVEWSPDSKAFYVRRTDSRKVKPLYLVNSLANPRPTLVEYKYAMPGEEDVNVQEMWLWKEGLTALKEMSEAKKWKDQQYLGQGFRWDTPTKIRFVRRDRLQRNLEYVEYDITNGSVTPLITESVNNANLEQPQIQYTAKDNGDIIWWSERTGWGHYYLYDHNGKLKNAITSGQWRAAQIVALDSTKRVLYVAGLGREEGENPYYRHMYKVNLDGSGLTLMDAGNAMHSPSATALNSKKTYYVDNASRTDMIPKAVVRDEFGKVVMDLETTDMSSLKEMGWKPSEPFMVKAADGVTPIWGNMYKPFDFDSTKKYPIVAHVYPGPQTEGVTYNFTTGGIPQRLANLGFIVVQLGNRGGSPDRSNAYQSFSYYNMRDYGLADKKAGLEQLAAKHKFIDIERVGIYGHSGGGFMTAAAMMLPPYNDFFKVGVSSAGNHDNNIYNQNWSEQYHGLAEVIAPPVVVAENAGGRGGRGANNGVVQQGNVGGGNFGGGRGANAAAAANAARAVRVSDSVRYEIRVPTTVELAPNLKGNLLIAHGDMDNNVTPSGSIRLADALIRANKRFDYLIMPGQAHGFGPMQNYFNDRLMEYFAEHLLGDYYRGTADMTAKKP
jgi:dipeptidyl aminopeptidase/acylaminoacyl peptidase